MTCLPCSGVGEEEALFTNPSSLATDGRWRASPEVMSVGELASPTSATALGEKTLTAPYLGSTAKLALLVWEWVSWSESMRVGDLTVSLAD